MLEITHAAIEDMLYVCRNEHLSQKEFALKVRDKRAYILRCNGERAGAMVFNLIFDFIPFLTLIHLEDCCRRKGFGRQAMAHWENEMRSLGYKMIMVSTQVNEDAQHFYRKMGYKDMGSIVMNIPPYEQPLEMFLGKGL